MNIVKIYLVTNCFNDPNKVYIGKTKQKWGRKSKHQITYGNQITYTYIDQVNSLNVKDWKPLENFWINYFRFLGFEVLNQNEGGGGPSFHTEKSRNKISKTHLGKKRSEETKQKMRKPKLDSSNMKKPKSEETKKNMKGPKSKKHVLAIKNRKWLDEWSKKMRKPKKSSINYKGPSKESGKKISKSKLGKSNFKRFRPILQFDKQGNFIKEWNSIKEATQSLKINRSTLVNCCRGTKQKTAGGFIWKYKD